MNSPASKYYSGVPRGQTTPGGSQEGAAKVGTAAKMGMLRDHQASHDIWGGALKLPGASNPRYAAGCGIPMKFCTLCTGNTLQQPTFILQMLDKYRP